MRALLLRVAAVPLQERVPALDTAIYLYLYNSLTVGPYRHVLPCGSLPARYGWPQQMRFIWAAANAASYLTLRADVSGEGHVPSIQSILKETSRKH